MNHIFILGSHPTWSVAEIGAMFGFDDLTWSKERILVKEQFDLNAETLIRRLGGTLKIAQVELVLDINTSFLQLAKNSAKIISAKAKRGEGKLIFGLSDHGVSGRFSAEKLGLQIKKELKQQNISSRLVTSREKELSSVVVGQNKLLTKGAELIFYSDNNKIVIARTLAIQDYKDLSRRDYGRPARDDHSGMLPPKLAQMMINITQQNELDSLLLDPFCGSGTIIHEAMLLGYSNLIGTDLSAKAIQDSRTNTSWMKDLYALDVFPHFHIKNATRLHQFLKKDSVTSIVTEPYLGPQRGLKDIALIKDELQTLYQQALSSFSQILKKQGRIVMVWPVFFGQEFLDLNLDDWKLVKLMPDKFLELEWVKLSHRDTLLYHRPGQKVWRELIVLEKK